MAARDDILDLLLANAEDIDYGSLSTEVLEQLALELEPYVATLALGELSGRDPRRAERVEHKLLSDEQADRHLRAYALTLLFRSDPSAGLSWIARTIDGLDESFTNDVIKLLAAEPDWCDFPGAEDVRMALSRRLAEAGTRSEIDVTSARKALARCDD